MTLYASSCERPSKRSARVFLPSSVSNSYSFSTRTQGSSRRFCLISWSRSACSASSFASSSRAACHCSLVPVSCSGISCSFSSSPSHKARPSPRGNLIDARYRERLDVPTLARAAHLSTAHFSREFRRAFGETPHQYLLTRRLERAAELLRKTDHSVADICFTVGLKSVGSFTTSFRRVYGLSPTAYRAAKPPHERARIPTRVLQAYARPHSSSFREDSSAA